MAGIDYYQNIEMKCSEDVVMILEYVERERIFYFLAGLNVKYDQVKA